jgi:hypothetical protein
MLNTIKIKPPRTVTRRPRRMWKLSAWRTSQAPVGLGDMEDMGEIRESFTPDAMAKVLDQIDLEKMALLSRIWNVSAPRYT